MLYIIVLAVILVAVILIFVVRKVSEKQRVYKANHSTDLPRTTQDLGEPVTFRGTARDVTDRVFRPGEMRGEEYDSEEYRPFNRGNMYSVPAVERTNAEGDPDLPRYGDTRSTTAVRAPERAYNPNAPPRQTGAINPAATSTTSLPRDAPPQYVRSMSTPAITQPPVVSAAS